MRCPTLSELPAPPPGKAGWPWTKEVSEQPTDLTGDGRRWPRVSIVTPSYNQGEYIEETIRSVLLQGYPDLEYIVIDGSSTDGSVEIIRKYARWLAYWSSHPDEGQADAINQGLARSTGEIFAFLNSDDLYWPRALSTAARHFVDHPMCRWVCGHTLMFGLPGKSPVIWSVRVPKNAAEHLFGNSLAISQSCLWRRDVFEQYGNFATEYRYSFDAELFARLLLAGEHCEPVDALIATYRFHPKSKTVGESDEFERQLADVRKRFLPQLPYWEVRRESVRKRWRDAGGTLNAAINDWRSGNRRAGILTGLKALRKSPAGVLIQSIKWLFRRIAAKTGHTGDDDQRIRLPKSFGPT